MLKFNKNIPILLMIGIFSGFVATKSTDSTEMIQISTFCVGAAAFLGIIDLRGNYA